MTKTTGTFWILATLSLLIVALTFGPSMGGLWEAWQREEYSHGLLIPLIAVLIGWHRLSKKTPPLAPAWTGLLCFLIGFALLAISTLSAFEQPTHYGFMACLTGLVLAFGGWRTLWVLLPALIYLVFAIPLPRLIEVALTAKMQLASTSLGVMMLQWLQIPVFQDGNIIDLGLSKLQVVEACSGLRYLFPLMSFGFLVAYLYKGPFWKRSVIFLSTIPLTLIMNSLRIALAGVLVTHWGPGAAEGLMHDVEGFVIFGLCVAVLLAETWALSSIGKSGDRLTLELFSIPRGPVFGTASPDRIFPAFGAFAVCVACSGALMFSQAVPRDDITPARKSFVQFPLRIDGWQGRIKSDVDPDVREALGATDVWSASYTPVQGDTAPPVDLFMAYYESQHIGVSAHSPANCIPGSGWRVAEKGVMPIELGHMTLPVTRMLIRKDKASLLVYYWFDQRGRIMNEQYSAKWYLLVDSIMKQRTDGGIVRLTTIIPEEASIDNADTRLQEFLRVVFPVTRPYLPQ